MIGDKEVGEIWRWVMSGTPDDAGVAMNTQYKIEQLIRKLVEERTKIWFKSTQESMSSCSAHALADFGIRPEDWKE